MNATIIKKLEAKTKEELLEILISLDSVKGVSEFIKLNYLMKPEDKVKVLTKAFAKYKLKTRFHDYHETNEFFDNLTTEVLKPIALVLNEAPEASATLIQSMIDGFESLVAAKDDSSGCAGQFLADCVELWGKAWQAAPNKDLDKLANLVVSYYLNQGYIGSEIFAYFKVALGKPGLFAAEQQLTTKQDMRLFLMELQNEPDRYIAELDGTNTHLNVYELKAAEMLIDHLRSDEAIKRLMKIPDNRYDTRDYIKRQELLIKAFSDEGQSKNAQDIRWQTFTNTLEPKYYNDFIKFAAPEVQAEIRQQAIELSLKNNDFNATLVFLEAIEEYECIEDLIVKNLDKLDQYNYSYYRKLSKSLAVNGKMLSAVLIRRSLVDDLLAKAASKYYDYAVSDLKLAVEFGNQVQNWLHFANTSEYLDSLKLRHKKKYSFWERISFV